MLHCPACHNQVEPDATKCGICNAPFAKPARGILESRLTQSQEHSIAVHPAVPIALGLAGVGGAAFGFVALAAALIGGQVSPGFGTIVVLLIGTVLYAFSAYCGVFALQRRFGWLRKNFVLWAIQVPVFTTPLLSYTFATGALLSIWVRPNPPGAGFNYFLGSSFAIQLFTPSALLIGVNALALAVAWYLLRLERSAV